MHNEQNSNSHEVKISNVAYDEERGIWTVSFWANDGEKEIPFKCSKEMKITKETAKDWIGRSAFAEFSSFGKLKSLSFPK